MESKQYTVYVHRTQDGKSYVGTTGDDVNIRWGNNGKNYSGQKFHNVIKECGWDSMKHLVLLKNLEKSQAEEMERLFIKLYRSSESEYGYNVLKGGNVLSGHSDETKNKISKTMSVLQLGENNTMYGKPSPARKKVLCVETGIIYESLMSTQDKTGIQFKNIHKVCQGQRHTAGGYRWKYVDKECA